MDEKKKEQYFNYLDVLRACGDTNMFGAAKPLMEEYPELTRQEAREVLKQWMDSFK